MKNIILTIISIALILQLDGLSQNTGYYYKYDFENFIASKTKGYNCFMEDLYKTIRYPTKLREGNIEGSAKFFIISHGDNKYEIIAAEHSNPFHESVLSQVQKLECMLNQNSEKYFVEFNVNFDLEPFEKIEPEKNTVYVKITSHTRY